jgi:hypothetical protein
MNHDMEEAKNLKVLLSVFEQLSASKINFHKSEISTTMGMPMNEKDTMHNFSNVMSESSFSST